MFTKKLNNVTIKVQINRFYANDSIILTNIKNLLRFFSIKKEYL